MKITERLYINRLEEMVGLYKDDICEHCPMADDFCSNQETICETDEEGLRINIQKSCDICRKLTWKYGYSNPYRYGCPCHSFEGTDTNMVAVAWKVIHGWRKDNPEGIDDE